jgi:hypothetical protein
MNKLTKLKVIGLTVVTVSLLASATVFAVMPAQAKARLQDAKLKMCQAKENVIKNRSTSLNGLVENMLEKFDAIALRVENYYTNTVIPSGKTVANYDVLLADIQTKKAAVQTALTKAKDDFKTFSCTGNDPKGALEQYRKDMQAVKQAMADYRTSIKNLIVAIHSVTGETNKATNPPSTVTNNVQ